MENNKIYFVIDLKTFYASVECATRGLDPFSTNLIVADPSRGNGSICLAITPAMKALGIKNRCRVFEIPKNVAYIVAKPRMKLYIEYAAKIYAIYLRYISPEDIHPYSIDEMFIDATTYLKLYKTDANKFAKFLMKKIYDELHITATCGIGTNLYLAKIALDISAKHKKDNIAYLDEEKYIKELGNHQPLSDFWMISTGYMTRLNRLGLYTMNDIAKFDEKKLYKEFGINAEILIDHSKGIEPVEMKHIKAYKRKSNSISQSQILFRDYTFEEAKIIVKEMVEILCLDLVDKGLVSNQIGLSVGYSKEGYKTTGGSKKLSVRTNVYSVFIDEFLDIYERTTKKDKMIRRIGIGFNNVVGIEYEQYDLFTDVDKIKKEQRIDAVINNLKEKYGKKSILKGMNFEDSATARERNKLIGGHNGGEDESI